MSYEQMEKLFEHRNQELAAQGFAGEFDGPVSATELTQLEIDSLRQDLKNSVAKGRQILQSRQKKFNI